MNINAVQIRPPSRFFGLARTLSYLYQYHIHFVPIHVFCYGNKLYVFVVAVKFIKQEVIMGKESLTYMYCYGLVFRNSWTLNLMNNFIIILLQVLHQLFLISIHKTLFAKFQKWRKQQKKLEKKEKDCRNVLKAVQGGLASPSWGSRGLPQKMSKNFEKKVFGYFEILTYPLPKSISNIDFPFFYPRKLPERETQCKKHPELHVPVITRVWSVSCNQNIARFECS